MSDRVSLRVAEIWRDLCDVLDGAVGRDMTWLTYESCHGPAELESYVMAVDEDIGHASEQPYFLS